MICMSGCSLVPWAATKAKVNKPSCRVGSDTCGLSTCASSAILASCNLHLATTKAVAGQPYNLRQIEVEIEQFKQWCISCMSVCGQVHVHVVEEVFCGRSALVALSYACIVSAAQHPQRGNVVAGAEVGECMSSRLTATTTQDICTTTFSAATAADSPT